MKPPELELVLLGALLDSQEPGPMLDMCGWSAEQLYDPRVRTAWGIVRTLVSRRLHVDADTVFSAGKAGNRWDDSARTWLHSLQAANTVVKAAFGQIAEDLRRHLTARALLEQLRTVAQEVKDRGLDPAKVSGALDAIARSLSRDYAPDQTAAEDLLEVIAEPGKRAEAGSLLLVPTGVRAIDEVIRGWQPNHNMVLGDPGVGKNAVIGSMITAQARAGFKIGLFGLEEGTRWLSERELARQLKMPVLDVGAAPWTSAQNEQLAGDDVNELHRVLQSVKTYSWDGVSADELVRRATSWVLQHGVQCIYIDHIGEIRHKGRDGDPSYNWAVAESYRRIRDFARRHTVPVVMLAHRKPDAVGRPGPPKPEDVGLTGEAHKMVRLMLGLWRKKQSLRCTVIKANKGEPGKTIELERLFEAALIDPAGGAAVSLEKEAREDAKAKKQQALEAAEENKLYWEDWREKRKAAKSAPAGTKVEKPAQPDMFDGKAAT